MASKPVSAAAKVVPFFRRRADLDSEPEISLAPATQAQHSAEAVGTRVTLDLSDRSKALFLIGLGGTGKTTLARWIAGRMYEQGREAMIAALDPQKHRSLAGWFEGVATPESNDTTGTARWLRQLLGHLMDNKVSALLDFGGGDTSLARTLAATSGLADTLHQNAVEPVAIYTLTPRIDDLAPLTNLEAAGFKPEATILVLNEGKVDESVDRDAAFARIQRHSAYRAAVDRGAAPVWMPKMDQEVALDIEGKRLHFTQTRDGIVPAGKSFSPTGWETRLEVKGWLDAMERAFAPVASWLL